MALKNGANMGLLSFGLPGEAHYLNLMAQWRALDFWLNPRIISMTTLAPPGSPVDGDAYIIPASATGAWAGRTNQAARWTTDLATPAWEFYTPKSGWGSVFNIADNTNYIYNGTAWVNASGLVTGEFRSFQLTAAPAGWIAGDGSTIGNVGSGATRANVDTLNLFTAWWSYSDATLPILTSAGAASTRGASAAADWAALKRLTVFDVRDRVVRNVGTVQLNGAKLEATEVYDHFGAPTVMVLPSGNGISTNNRDGAGAGVTQAYNQVAATTGAATTLVTSKVRVASIGMLGCYKL